MQHCSEEGTLELSFVKTIFVELVRYHSDLQNNEDYMELLNNIAVPVSVLT